MDKVDPNDLSSQHRLLNGRRAIINSHLAADHIATVCQLAANPLLMGVEDAAQHQFASGVNEFDLHNENSMAHSGLAVKLNPLSAAKKS